MRNKTKDWKINNLYITTRLFIRLCSYCNSYVASNYVIKAIIPKANKKTAPVTLVIPFAFLISFSGLFISNSQADNNPVVSVTSNVITPIPDFRTPCSFNLEKNTEHNVNKYEVLPRSPYALWDHFPEALFNTQSSNPSNIDTLLFVAYKYRNSGHPNIALNVLEQAQDQANKENNKNRLALIEGGMSDAYLLLRNLDRALISSKKSVALARQTRNNLLLAMALNHYGNALATMQRYQEALQAYREGELLAKKSSDKLMLVKLIINSVHILIVQDSISEAVDALKEGSAIARKSSSLYEKTYILVSLGYLAHHLQQNTPFYLGSLDDVSYSTLTDARTIAEEIADANIQSYTLGHLGEFHAAQQHEKKAHQYFQQAISLARKTKSPELTARWLWQLGRLFKIQNKIKEAEASYREALFQLAKIQSALVYGYRGELQSFREDIGAIYLELVDILVQKASSMDQEKNQYAALKDTLNLMEQYRKIELKDYFQDECLSKSQDQTKISAPFTLPPNTAALYPIVFPDRMTVILRWGDDSMKQISIPVNAKNLLKQVTAFHHELQANGNPRRLRAAGWKLYDWLIKPLEGELKKQNINTIAIIPDGILRTIPYAALFDGKEFLVKRYAFVTTTGLTHTISSKNNKKITDHPILLNGLSKSVQQHAPLPNVLKEIKKVSDQFDKSTLLLDEAFNKKSVENQLKLSTYSTVLFASHAELKANPKQSFILTHDDKISLDDLGLLMRIGKNRTNPINLLVLSACETATGDERAAFGLAGIAVKSGVSSVLASLWAVNDESTSELIPLFFENLKKTEVNKALALQQAQIKMLVESEYKHPYHWASFVLFGHWI